MNSTLSAKLLDDYEILDCDDTTPTHPLQSTSCSESGSMGDIAYAKQCNQTKGLESSAAGFFDLMSCIKSEEDFQNNCDLVVRAVQMNQSSYNESLLQAISTVFTSPKYSSVFKFYSLFLLVKLIEANNSLFNSQLALEKELVFQITRSAEEIVKTRPIEDNSSKESSKGVSSFLLSKANNLRDLIKTSTTKFTKKTEQNSEESQRQKFEDLLLEAVKFWNSKYGRYSKNPLSQIYCSLNGKITFPEKYYYLANYNPKGPSEVACITGGSSFVKNYKLVVEVFNAATEEKAKKFLEGTRKILSSPDVWAASKFYALYLLIKVTESRNTVFMNMFANSRELLNLLFSQAQFDRRNSSEDRGSKIFSRKPHPQEAVIGINYLQLLLEAISFWGTVYGTDDNTSPFYIFSSMKSRLKSRFLTKSYYVPRDLEQLDHNILDIFELIPFREISEILEDYIIDQSRKTILEETVKTANEESGEPKEANQGPRLQLEVIFENLKKINKISFIGTNALQKRLSQLGDYFNVKRRKIGYQDVRGSLLPLLTSEDPLVL